MCYIDWILNLYGQGQDYKWRPGGGEDTPVDGPATILSNSNQWKLLHIVVK